MTRTQRILGLSGLCLLLSGWAGCYFNREGGTIATDDADGDGWTAGVDCNDNDFLTYPGADEICGDGVDNDCDNLIDFNDPDCRVDGAGASGQGGIGQGGNGQGGTSQGGAGQGGDAQGGGGQGGAGQGGAGQGGSAQGGGAGTGGSGTGGSGTGGGGTGGAGTGGSGTGGS